MHRPPLLRNAERKRAADIPLVQHDPPAPVRRVRDRAISAASSRAVRDEASTNPAARRAQPATRPAREHGRFRCATTDRSVFHTL
jgi:hypothetical protein